MRSVQFLHRHFAYSTKPKFDGSGAYGRLRYFSDYPGYKASNPVVGDDGRFIAFQMAKRGK